MTLEELVEAHLAGDDPTVPNELREEFQRAIAAHRALEHALGETIVLSGEVPAERGLPALPADYQILRELGRGGMGVVYLARQRSLGRDVAVKVLRPGEIAFGPLVRRFVEEARHLARLRHPNIVSIHETGQAGDEPYFTMDFVEGESLAATLKRGPLPPTQALHLLTQAAAGVEHAHAQGIIHRDLKPANILVDRGGHAYVTDFGLARDTSRASELTGSGDVLGTPAYMAPEQALGQTERIGEATDVHALGAILYEMLTGKAPYGHGAPAEILIRLLKEEPTPPRAIDRRIPRDLATICMKALAKTPEGRYATVHAFLEDLRRFEAGDPIRARGPGLVRASWRMVVKHWYLVVALGIVAFLFLLGFGIARTTRDTERKSTLQATLAAAEALHQHGDHLGAVRIYADACGMSDAQERERIVRLMALCCAELAGSEGAVEAWERVVSIAPNRSFGAYDFACEEALVTRLRTKHKFLEEAARGERPAAERAASRLRIALAGRGGTEEERAAASADLATLQRGLAPPVSWTVDPDDDPLDLPKGPTEEWERMWKDSDAAPWIRGKLRYRDGVALEKAGKREEALVQMRTGFDLLRRAAPCYSWSQVSATRTLKDEKTSSYELDWSDDEPNARPLKAAQEALRRLDPSAPDLLRGGIIIPVEGLDQARGLAVNLQIDVVAPEFAPPFGSRGAYPGVWAGVRSDGTARVGVADGRYRLTPFGRSLARAADDAVPESLIEIDAAPSDIEVRGGWTRVPPVRIRRLQDIDLQTPANGSSVDLRSAVFQWSAVEGATAYRLVLGVCLEGNVTGAQVESYASVTSPTSRACLGTMTDGEVHGRFSDVQGGRSGEWYVEACDAKGRVVGRSAGRGRVFLAHGLEGK